MTKLKQTKSKQTKMKQIIFLLAIVFLMFSCKKAEVDCVDTSYTYEADILPIMKTSCNTTGCHNSGSSNGDFTTYAGLKPLLDNGEFNQRVFVI